jgi:hypothetical protein
LLLFSFFVEACGNVENSHIKVGVLEFREGSIDESVRHRLATNRTPELSKFKGRLSSEAEAGNYDAYSDVVSRRLCYKVCVVSGEPQNSLVRY